MSDIWDPVLLQVRVKDLERRVQLLEARLSGEPHRPHTDFHLLTLYYEALKHQKLLTKKLFALWQGNLLNLTAEQLLTLAKITEDPFPWKPFVLLLERFRAADFDVEETMAHVLSVARDLMDAQGLRKIQVEDVMGTPPLPVEAIQAAFSSISE